MNGLVEVNRTVYFNTMSATLLTLAYYWLNGAAVGRALAESERSDEGAENAKIS